MNLKKLKQAILEDGIIDADEVNQLRTILYDDGVIDQEEADMLFELNDEVSEKNNDPSWETLFISAICDFLLEDEVSPGEIDDDETKWLLDKIQGDGKVDDIELKLLTTLKSRAKFFPIELENLLQ